MEKVVDSPTIKPINKGVIHRICSGQVILDISSAVKELVENSLDAGATSIEISLKEYGEKSFKVIDNGSGISPSNFQVLALKHHTSKITDFPDLQSLTTFGFRGEALSSLCALGNLTIETRTKAESVGTHLTFDHSGLVTSERRTARHIGTTVTIEKLFSTLPVRSKEFSRNIRREYGKLISLLNMRLPEPWFGISVSGGVLAPSKNDDTSAYAVIAKGVRFICTNITGKNTKSVVLKTPGSSSLKDNIVTVFGMSTFACLEPLNICVSDGFKIEGFLSKPGQGSGRTLGDRQFFYVNGRPVDMPKVSKLVNELYKSSNSRQYPVAIMDFIVSTKAYDVNVAPDKRKIFFSDEAALLLSLRQRIESIYSPSHCSYSINKIEDPNKDSKEEINILEVDSPSEEDHSPPAESPKGGEEKAVVFYSEKKTNVVSWNIVEEDIQDAEMGDEVVQHEEGTPILKNIPFSSYGMGKSKTSSPHESKQPKIPIPNNPFSSYSMEKSKMSSPSESKEPKTPLHTRIEQFAAYGVRRNENSAVKNVDSSFRPNAVQSSLTKFITMNKRKHEEEHEDNCTVVSEMPILRGEILPCQRKKTHSEIQVSSSKPILSHHGGEDSTDIDNDKDSEDRKVPGVPNEEEILPLVSRYFDDRGSRESNTWFQCIRTDSPNVKKISNDLFECFAAATLQNSQPENEGKEKSLAAASIELERFFRKEDFGRMKVIGQFNLGFIIGKIDQDLFIVDQHAADEKYNFECLSQSTILNQQPLLQKNGFSLIEDADAPSGHHFLLKAVPFSKNITFGAEDVKELISNLADSQGECSMISSYRMDTKDSICPSRVRGMLASRACRSSVMIGDPLGKNEMQKILQNLVGLKCPWNCPHGRPTMRHLIDLTTVQKRYVETAE
ncbi:hypothetical protein ACLOJK_017867 [Asimina triloba]